MALAPNEPTEHTHIHLMRPGGNQLGNESELTMRWQQGVTDEANARKSHTGRFRGGWGRRSPMALNLMHLEPLRSGLPEKRNRILAEDGVAADEGSVLSSSGSDQESVERIPMHRGQLLQSKDVLHDHWQNLQLVGTLMIRDDVPQRAAELQLSQLGLDLHLPHAGHTQKH